MFPTEAILLSLLLLLLLCGELNGYCSFSIILRTTRMQTLLSDTWTQYAQSPMHLTECGSPSHNSRLQNNFKTVCNDIKLGNSDVTVVSNWR